VLAHDSCGAVRAAIDSRHPDAPQLSPHVAGLIAKILPAVERVAGPVDATGPVESVDAQQVGREHLRDTIRELIEASELISDAIAAGTLGVVGANYRLLEGEVVPDITIGNL
jgi:carbonic anhydrase